MSRHWSEAMSNGKKRLAGDTARQATGPEVKDLRQESAAAPSPVIIICLLVSMAGSPPRTGPTAIDTREIDDRTHRFTTV